MELEGIIEPTLHSVKIDEKINAEWLDNFCRLNNVEERNRRTMIKMLSNIATKKCLISLYIKEDLIAYGLGVIEREYIGL